MNYRKAALYEETDSTTAKTETIGIDIEDIISRLQIKFDSTNNGNTCTAHPAAQVSNVEIVDGSTVLLSLSAREIEALMFYETKKGRNYEIEYRNDCENNMVLDYYFGRYLFDPMLAFDPKKFKNPQLKITHNKASGGCAPDASTLQVWADVFDEKVPSPTGFIMSKEHYNWTSPSSAANEYIDLPNDYPIKRIGIETFKADSWWDNIISEVELDEETKKRLPWSIDGYELMKLALQKYGNYRENIALTTPGADYGEYYITPVEVAAIAPFGYGVEDVAVEAERVGGYMSVGSTSSPASMRVLVDGPIPHGFVPLDCGIQDDPSDWFDVTKKGKIKLRVKAGGTATVRVVLQQLRTY